MQTFIDFIFDFFSNFFHTVVNFFIFFKDFSLNILGAIFQFFEDFFLYIPKYLYSFITDFADYLFVACGSCGVNYIYSSILNGLSSFQSVRSSFESFDFLSCLAYFADIFSLDAGFQLLLCAYIFRFVIRRIPFVG